MTVRAEEALNCLARERLLWKRILISSKKRK